MTFNAEAQRGLSALRKDDLNHKDTKSTKSALVNSTGSSQVLIFFVSFVSLWLSLSLSAPSFLSSAPLRFSLFVLPELEG